MDQQICNFSCFQLLEQCLNFLFCIQITTSKIFTFFPDLFHHIEHIVIILLRISKIFILSTFFWFHILSRFSTSHSIKVIFFNGSTFFTGFKLTSFVLDNIFNWIIPPTRLFPSNPLPSYSTDVISSFQRFDFSTFQISSTVWELDIDSAVSIIRSVKAFLTSLFLNFHIQT